MTEDTALARQWLDGLAARGVTFRERSGRLRCHPERAYRTLSDEEIIFLRHHRTEIRAALRDAGPFVAPRHAAGLVSISMTFDQLTTALRQIDELFDERVEVWRTLYRADGAALGRIYRGSFTRPRRGESLTEEETHDEH